LLIRLAGYTVSQARCEAAGPPQVRPPKGPHARRPTIRLGSFDRARAEFFVAMGRCAHASANCPEFLSNCWQPRSNIWTPLSRGSLVLFAGPSCPPLRRRHRTRPSRLCQKHFHQPQEPASRERRPPLPSSPPEEERGETHRRGLVEWTAVFLPTPRWRRERAGERRFFFSLPPTPFRERPSAPRCRWLLADCVSAPMAVVQCASISRPRASVVFGVGDYRWPG